MSELIADASPEKHLFLEMFIRDLTLEDSILDLVDNSIDSLIRERNIDVSEALEPLGSNRDSPGAARAKMEPASINITFNDKYFHVEDNCGGISVEDAKEEVFRFGHSKEAKVGQLGVYGIGLKRALFKIGNDIIIESKTVREGFKMVIDVPNWSDDRRWELPFEVIDGTGDPSVAGTSITIKSFRPEVAERLRSGTLEA
ncbi:ATP-binding protein, partial [bacterium]|nr:ATP-binding protein [bacterium]